ncbi:MAG TPA: hypothetical protein VIK11_12935 [Tepidiformaceae bacterium]
MPTAREAGDSGMPLGKKLTIIGIFAGIAAVWIGLLLAVGFGVIGGSEQPTSAQFVFKEVSFGPFLIVAPDTVLPANQPPAATAVNDETVLEGSPLFISLPPTYARTGVSGSAVDGELVSVTSDWRSASGAKVEAAMTKVDPASLPIAIVDTAADSHLLVQHKMLAGRYAIVEGPSLCSTELTGGSVTVWMDGATLTLTSSEASTSDLQNILTTLTTTT